MRARELGKLILNPFQVHECSSQHCDKMFAIIDGWAFPGRDSSGELRLYFFHSDLCFLEALPPEACYRA